MQSCQTTVINSRSVHSRVTQLHIHDPNQAHESITTELVRWQYLREIYCISNHWLTIRSGLWRLGSTYPLPRRGIRRVLLSFLVSVVRSQAWMVYYSTVLKSPRDHDNTLKSVLQSAHTVKVWVLRFLMWDRSLPYTTKSSLDISRVSALTLDLSFWTLLLFKESLTTEGNTVQWDW